MGKGNLKRVAAAASAPLLLAVGLTTTGPSAGAHPSQPAATHVCPKPTKTRMTCYAMVVTKSSTSLTPHVTPYTVTGYGPTQFHTAYKLPTSTTVSKSETIAIVDAYHAPSALTSLNKFNSHFGLPSFPKCSSTVTKSCLKTVNENGGSTLTAPVDPTGGWGVETDLDVQGAHEICQKCKILLVEADSASGTDLFTALNTAINKADIVSNSWGGPENGPITGSAPGVAITFSSGDNGYGTNAPAAANFVTAVGGTKLLLKTDNTRQSETVWGDGISAPNGDGAGSGCSAYNSAKSWQTSLSNWSSTGCGSKRAVADVSADADPDTGAAVRIDNNPYYGTGWIEVGGTSLAAPLVAGIYGLAGDFSGTSIPAKLAYTHATSLKDVTSGSNGTCSQPVMCSGGPGYDGPSGLGAPKGLAGF